ncbi:LPXTG cell wall anchor domain-containing protein, partial [Paenibacillus sp. JCM 10914]|uniref:LPXTG cell wall anchor domain-containing protein n=1 Tax=Paenibacillus sp. JCM 10914 TaxID=1236974 RepID=UPI000567FBCF
TPTEEPELVEEPTPTEEPELAEEPTPTKEPELAEEPTPFEPTNEKVEINVLPKTGEESKALFYVAGSVFIVAALWLLRRDSIGRG